MPSKFGGIPVEDQSASGSKFGGVPVDEPPIGAPPTEPGNHGLGEFITSPHGFLREGARQIGQGAKELFTSGQRQRGATDVLKGAGSMLAPVGIGAAIPAAIAAPVSTIGALGAGALGSGAGEAGGRALATAAGGGPDAQELAGTVGSLGGGLAGGVGGFKGTRALGGKAAEGLANSALGTTAKTRQFGTNPGRAVLQETEGVKPAAVAESARQRIGELTPVKERMVEQANPVSLASPRQRLAGGESLASRQNDPLLSGEVRPMQATLHNRFDTGESIPETVPARDALDLLRGFGNQHVRFVEGRTNTANDLAKGTWADLRNAIREKSPESAALDERISNLIPARDLATRAQNLPGSVETGVSRLTRPTGGLIPMLAGFHAGGPIGGAAVMGAQEALSSPAVKMAMARGLFRGVGGQRLGVPPMPLRQIEGPADTSGPLPHAVADFRSVGAENPRAPRALLGGATPGQKAPLVTPPPADTSGTIPNAPPNLRGYPAGIQQRLLGAPKPPIQQGGFATGTTNDLVPFKHPATGKIEYVPKWMLQGQGE